MRMGNPLREMLQPECRRVLLPGVVGWAAYGLLTSVVGMALYPNVPEWQNMVYNILVLILTPCGIAAHVLGAVRSTRALTRGYSPRWVAITAAVLSWGGVLFTLYVAVFLVICFILYW